MRFTAALVALGAGLFGFANGQQYAGDVINNTLPLTPGSEIAYFRINDPKGKNNNLTLINYISHGSDGKRLVPSKLQRLVVVVHGQNRDPGTYMSNMLSALSQVKSDSNINFNSVGIMAPYFPNGEDKNYGYPWTDGLAPGYGSTSNALVWYGSQWSAGADNQYPRSSRSTSSYDVLDQICQYYGNTTLFPNMKQIIISGHSLGAQTVQRYAAIGLKLSVKVPINLWIGNPNSLVWLDTSRPLPIEDCDDYDDYRDGYTNFTEYPMRYNKALVASGRANIVANFQSKTVNWGRGIQDMGDDSSSCAPFTTGNNRNERFFNFIKAWPPSCADPKGALCDTVDFVNTGHDAGAMFASAAGQARLFIDNFYGNGNRSYDFGYPRYQAGDDPYPNPALVNTPLPPTNNTGTYAGGMTYQGCYSDQTPNTLPNMVYSGNANSIEYCTSLCNSKGYKVAGMEFSSQCFCGNALGYLATPVIEMSCSLTCSGNSTEKCGGSNRISIFSNGTPAKSVRPVTPATIGQFTSIGCYNSANGRFTGGNSFSGNTVSLDSCAAFCSQYQYFGAEYGQECYCGNNFVSGISQAASGDCSMLCAANNTEFCGAGNRMTTYQNLNYTASSSSSATGSPTATSSGGSPSATSSGLSCPGSNGTTYTSNGLNFTIECGIDHAGGDMSSLSVSSFNQCVDTCANTQGCVDVSLSGSACYLKSTLGAAVKSGGIWGAKLVVTSTTSSIVATSTASSVASSVASSATSSSSVATSATSSSAAPSSTAITCPASNGTTYTSNGLNFLIECGIDHAGGDMSSLSVSSFNQCVDTCATTTGCVDVSLSGSACYLKSTLGAVVNSGGIWGAKLLVSPTTSSVPAANNAASSVASSATSSATSAAVTSSAPVTSTTSTTTSSATSTVTLTTSTTTSSATSTVTSSSTTSTTSTATSSSATSTITSSSTTSSTSTSFITSTLTSSAAPSSTPVTCPGSNSTTVVSYGATFIIECGIDHAGGDMKSLSVKNLQGCIDACATTPGCVDLSLSGSACYLKKSVGAAVYNKVFGARLLASAATSSAAATSTAT